MALAAALLCCGCASTPGDAASRLGHPEQAADLYRRGAEQGDAEAALKLGLLLDQGPVAGSGLGSAADWYVKACDLGSPVGCHNVGVGFEYGKSGLDKNLESARAYYLRAARQGYMQSQYNLGSLYANQYLSDDVEGLAWLLAAQEAASHCASDSLCRWVLDDPPGHISKLKARMSPSDIARAGTRALDFN